MTLWISNRGEVACGKSPSHGGAYLMFALKNAWTNQTRIDTPLDSWQLVPRAIVDEEGLECEGCIFEQDEGTTS